MEVSDITGNSASNARGEGYRQRPSEQVCVCVCVSSSSGLMSVDRETASGWCLQWLYQTYNPSLKLNPPLAPPTQPPQRVPHTTTEPNSRPPHQLQSHPSQQSGRGITAGIYMFYAEGGGGNDCFVFVVCVPMQWVFCFYV